MSEPFGTTEQLDLEAIESRVRIIQGTEYDRGTWVGGMLTFLASTEVPALIAAVRRQREEVAERRERELHLMDLLRNERIELASLQRQLGALCPVGDLDTITSLRVEIEALREQVAALEPDARLGRAVRGMERGCGVHHMHCGDWAMLGVPDDFVSPDGTGDPSPDVLLGLEESSDE